MTFDSIMLKVADVIHELGELYRDRLYAEAKDLNLTQSQCYYLECIDKLDEPSLSDVAQALKVAKSSVSTSITNLIKIGAVEKRRSLKDQRAYTLHLTGFGKCAVFLDKEVHRLSAEFIGTSLKESELHELGRLLQIITHACEEEISNLKQENT